MTSVPFDTPNNIQVIVKDSLSYSSFLPIISV